MYLHTAGKQGASQASLSPGAAHADILGIAYLTPHTVIVLVVDIIQDRACHLVAVPGNHPEVGLKERVCNPAIVIILINLTCSPVVAESLIARLPDRLIVLRLRGTYFQSIRHGRVRYMV